MKKRLLLFAAILVTLNSYSQTEKGKYMIGGRFNFSGYNSSSVDSLNQFDSKSNGVQIYPNVGYFIKDNVAIGVSLNIGFSGGDQNSSSSNYTPVLLETHEYSSINYGAGIFGRYYKKVINNFYIALAGNISYNKEVQEREFATNNPNYVFTTSNPAKQETHINSVSVTFTPVLVYFVTTKLGIEGGFGNIYYSHLKSENISISRDNSNESSIYGVNLNSTSLFFGLNYYF